MRLASSTTTSDRRVDPVPRGDSTPPAALPPRPVSGRRRTTRIYAPSHRYAFRLRDLWRYRGLLRYFGKLYVKRRYRRTWLGWIWVPLRPAADMAGRVLLFGGLLSVSSGTRPYFMFFIVGSAAWRFFSIGVLMATRSLDMNQSLFQRVNLPRASAVAAAIVPAAIEAGIFVLMGIAGALYFKATQGSFYIVLGPSTLAAVAGAGLLAIYVFAVGLWTAPLAANARDVRFLLSYVLGFWYVATPIIYPISSIPQQFRPLALYNPLTAPVELVKYGLLETARPATVSLVVSFAVLGALLLGGVLTFARAEAKAAATV
jgi:lipopolysaccharide transport system permease protein